VPLNPVAVAVLLSDPQRQLMEKLTGSGRHEGLMSPVPLLRSGSVADGCRAWVMVALPLVLAAASGCRDECWESWFLHWRCPPFAAEDVGAGLLLHLLFAVSGMVLISGVLLAVCFCGLVAMSLLCSWHLGSNKAWGSGEEVVYLRLFW